MAETIEKQVLIEYLTRLRREATGFFPDDDSKNSGYIFAVEEILEWVRNAQT